MKKLFIAEKPSVAQEFAKALGVNAARQNGYIEQGDYIITWCVGHLVTMSYPDAYDEKMKKWSLETIPFVPEEYKYEIIPAASKQFKIVKELLNREDVGIIYVCTDSGREGEYIYRLVDKMAKVSPKKDKRRVWIDSQTEEEILRGIKEAKPLSEYDALSDAAYLRAKEDYLMGINFSRALTLKYAYTVKEYLGLDRCVIAVGRVMTCVLGMIVKREREIRDFTPTPFYRVIAPIGPGRDSAHAMAVSGDTETMGEETDPDNDWKTDDLAGSGTSDKTAKKPQDYIEVEWRAVSGSKYFESPLLYKENGFKRKPDAETLIGELSTPEPIELKLEKVERKTEKKNPPLLYNLAELQNDCSRIFKISPSETLEIVQELYEKKLVTYPRTDARVLSTAVAKEIDKNLRGLSSYDRAGSFAEPIVRLGGYKNITKSRYVNDKQITDHYAIIPTGQGLSALNSISPLKQNVYELIARRFIAIFYAPAEYEKLGLTCERNGERLFGSMRRLVKPGYLKVMETSFGRKKQETEYSEELENFAAGLKKGDMLPTPGFYIREGETSAPKRYSSGTLILAMENAGQLILDEELRETIKGSGIGTSATRDAIITKLVTNKYIALNKKTQIVTPTFLGEIIYDTVLYSINGLLRADLTASWEKGLAGVADGSITKDEYSEKMNDFVVKYTNFVKGLNNQYGMRNIYDKTAPFYTKNNAKNSANKSL